MLRELFDRYEDGANEGEWGVNGCRVTPPTCKHCGKEGLSWRGVGLGWKLYEGSQPHRCPITNDFEDLTGGTT